LYLLYRIRRDECGNLGIQIKAGSDGGLYVQSVVPYGPAAALGTVHRGEVLQYGLCYTYIYETLGLLIIKFKIMSMFSL
jgi:hypothetical protein